MKNLIYIILSYFKKSFSQEGEDLILLNYFKNKKKGFYVDIGAHHPFRFSNTNLFYKKGWSGINIDATPGSMKMFDKYRFRDINIEIPVSNDNKRINYYIFGESALNSFSSKLSRDRNINTKYKIKEIIKLRPRKLSEILDEHMPTNTNIDFMSIDVEGYEYEVLISNNWKKYKPTYLLVEVLKNGLLSIKKDKSYAFLISKGYSVVNETGRTVVFKKQYK